MGLFKIQVISILTKGNTIQVEICSWRAGVNIFRLRFIHHALRDISPAMFFMDFFRYKSHNDSR